MNEQNLPAVNPVVTAIEAIPVAPTAQDVSENVALVAMTPEDMGRAQSSLGEWFEAKRLICLKDAEELTEAAKVAADNGWSSYRTLDRQSNLAFKRAEFYAKCKGAVDAGYCIVPNFDIDVFAVRTARRNPDTLRSTFSGTDRSHKPEGLPSGEGEYKNPNPVEMQTAFRDGDKTRYEYWAKEFRDEIEFPISVRKPEIMNATARAMAMKIFDEVGIAPDRRNVKKDPIILGRIKDPRSSKYNQLRVSFLIAWWVNFSDL